MSKFFGYFLFFILLLGIFHVSLATSTEDGEIDTIDKLFTKLEEMLGDMGIVKDDDVDELRPEQKVIGEALKAAVKELEAQGL